MEEKLIFISGGARSGKTSFAEAYAEKLARSDNRPLCYLASSQKEDEEMRSRVERHQRDREESDSNWQTVERPADIGGLASHFTQNEVALLDCVTLLLSNELFQGTFDEKIFLEKSFQNQVKNKIVKGITDLSKHLAYLFVVSNEVLYEPVHSENQVVWVYQKLLGEIHQEIVAHADEAYLIEASIPIRKK